MLLLVVGLQRSSVVSIAFCGVLVGLQFTIRPYTAILTMIWLAVTRLVVFRGAPKVVSQGLAFCAGLLPGVVALMIYNHVMVGSMWSMPFTVSEPYDRLGFGVRGWGNVRINHTLVAALRNLVSTAPWLLYPPVLSWLTIGAWFAARFATRNRSAIDEVARWDLCCILFPVVLVLGHTLYWCARQINYFEALPFLTLAVVRACGYLSERSRLAGWCVKLAVPGLIVLSAIVITDWYLLNVSLVRETHSRIERARPHGERLLVFVRPEGGALGAGLDDEPAGYDLSLGFFNLSLSADEPVIYAVDCGSQNVRLTERYPDRSSFLLLLPKQPQEEKGRQERWYH
jgi:hypothetical protein